VVRRESDELALATSTPGWDVQEIRVKISRSAAAPGLGLLLEEYGAGADDTGLTLITGLVADGNAARASPALKPGDAITCVRSAAGSSYTECRNYDRTIDALSKLAPAPAPALLTVKRLVKIPTVACTVMFPKEEERADRTINLYPGTMLRQALIMNGIAVEGCNEDLQCLCKCGMMVRKGRALLKPEESQERQMLNNKRMSEPNWRLTCRSFIVDDLEEDAAMVVRIRPDTENVMAPKDPNAWRT
jgi:ferredoxin